MRFATFFVLLTLATCAQCLGIWGDVKQAFTKLAQLGGFNSPTPAIATWTTNTVVTPLLTSMPPPSTDNAKPLPPTPMSSAPTAWPTVPGPQSIQLPNAPHIYAWRLRQFRCLFIGVGAPLIAVLFIIAIKTLVRRVKLQSSTIPSIENIAPYKKILAKMKDGRSRATLGSRMKHGVHVDQVKDAISRLREKVSSPDSTPVLNDNSSNIIDGFTITTPTDDLGSDKSGSAPPAVTNAQPKIQCGCTCKCVVTNAATSAQTEGLVPSTGANTQAPIASKTNNTVGGSANAPAVKGTFVKLVTAAEDSAIELAAAVAEGTIKHADNVVDTDVDTSNGEAADETGADSEGILVGLTAGAAGKPQLPPQADGGDEWPDGAGTPQTPMAANGDSKHGDMAPRTDEIGSSVDPSLAGHDNVCPVAQVASGLSAQQTQAASCGQHRVFQILATKLRTFYAATNEPRIDFNKYAQGSSRLENLSFKRSLVLCDRPIEELRAIKCGGPATQARYSEPATPAKPCASEPGTDKQRRCRLFKRLTDSSTSHVAGLLAAVNASLFGHLDEAGDMQGVELDSTSMQQPMVEQVAKSPSVQAPDAPIIQQTEPNDSREEPSGPVVEAATQPDWRSESWRASGGSRQQASRQSQRNTSAADSRTPAPQSNPRDSASGGQEHGSFIERNGNGRRRRRRHHKRGSKNSGG